MLQCDRTEDDNESAVGLRDEWYDTYLLGRHNLRVRANQIFLLQL